MVLEVLLDQRLDPREVDVPQLVLGALDSSVVLAAGEHGHGE